MAYAPLRIIPLCENLSEEIKNNNIQKLSEILENINAEWQIYKDSKNNEQLLNKGKSQKKSHK